MSIPKNTDGPPAISFEKPRKMGWLHKHGGSGMSSHWKKRWFIVDHHYMFYYKAPNDKKPVGILCLPEYNSCYKAESKDCKKPNSFILDKNSDSDTNDSGPSKNYILYAESEEEMALWISAIREEIKSGVGGGSYGSKNNMKVDRKAFDEVTAIASEGPKLTHLTTSRPKMKGRRPPKKYSVFHEDDSKEDVPESPSSIRTPPKPLHTSPASSPSAAKKAPMKPTKPITPPTKRICAERLGAKEPADTSPDISAGRPQPPKKPVSKDKDESSPASDGVSESVSKPFSKPIPPRKQQKKSSESHLRSTEESLEEKTDESKPLPAPPPKPKPAPPPKAKPRMSIAHSDSSEISGQGIPSDHAPSEPPTPTKRPPSSEQPTPTKRTRPTPVPRKQSTDPSIDDPTEREVSEISSAASYESESTEASQSEESKINEETSSKETELTVVNEEETTRPESLEKDEESSLSEDRLEVGGSVYEDMTAGNKAGVDVDDTSSSKDLYECMDYNNTTTTSGDSHSTEGIESSTLNNDETYVQMSPSSSHELKEQSSPDVYEDMNVGDVAEAGGDDNHKPNTPDSYEEPDFWRETLDSSHSSAGFAPMGTFHDDKDIPLYDVLPLGPPRLAYNINGSGSPSTVSASSQEGITVSNSRSSQSPEVGRRADSLGSTNSGDSGNLNLQVRKGSVGIASLSSSRNNSVSGTTGGESINDLVNSSDSKMDSLEKKGASDLNGIEKKSHESGGDTVPGTLQQAKEILRLAQAIRVEAEQLKEEAYRELELARRERHDASLLKKNAAEILKIAKSKLAT